MTDGARWIGSLDADRQTLQRLREAGGDLTKPTEISFYLYFDSEPAAHAAAKMAQTPSLTALVERAADDVRWICVLEGQMVPALDTIRAESIRLSSLATSLQGEYDGWEAAVRS